MLERKWVRNPKHRKYLPGEEEADDVRNEEEVSSETEGSSDEEQQPEESDG